MKYKRIKLNKREVNISALVSPGVMYSLYTITEKVTTVDTTTFYTVQFTPLLFWEGSVKYSYIIE